MKKKALQARPPKRPAPEKKRKLDWSTIRAEYEAGESARALGRKYECSNVSISARVKAEGWEQDAEGAIRKRTQEKLNGIVNSDLPLKRAEAIDAEAEKRVRIVYKHRAEAEEIRELVNEGLRDTKAATDKKEKDAAFDTLKAAKIASETITNLQRLERKSYGLDAEPLDEGQQVTRIVREIVSAPKR